VRRGPRGWFLGATVAVTLARPVEVRADGAGDQRSAAQVLFDRGQALVEQGHFVEACPQFAESERLDPGIGSLLWLADCYENTGQTANAWTTFEDAAAMAASRRDPREAVARDRAARLQARLSRVTIVVPPAVADSPGLQVRCDGVAVESLLWSHAISLDPGTHTITANAEGRQVWWTTVQLAAGTNDTSVIVPELAPLASPSASSPGSGSGAPKVEASPPDARGKKQRIGGVALAAAGAAGVIVGTVFSLNAKARYDDSAAFCLPNNQCAATGKQDRSDAYSMATVATVAIGLGAAAMIGGSLLYFTAPRTAPITVAMSPDARGGSLRVRWAW
jgi:hypothetical protein